MSRTIDIEKAKHNRKLSLEDVVAYRGDLGLYLKKLMSGEKVDVKKTRKTFGFIIDAYKEYLYHTDRLIKAGELNKDFSKKQPKVKPAKKKSKELVKRYVGGEYPLDKSTETTATETSNNLEG